ncbi:protein-lysine N-methyltransferase EEF2KMT isoform X2 [Anoplophora glabripennis]|uniref:protein-lysine N-methyltransferase EEF2KMT isoform X2 n=1 Tax=Anoplophora glabripennis TaxID=217634 RepID=UPI000873891F|nr:protein-lysine N-methyltransferase EEF2KMT isoform X2 [Anoplophora glabripennis]
MPTEKVREKIDYVVKQFLCNVPMQRFIWNNIFEDLTQYETQEILANRTVNCSLILNYEIEINYQKSFLKYLIEKLEKQGSPVHDELYSAYGRLVALPSRNEYFKHYSIKNSDNIAALALSEWSLLNVEAFTDKAVLELGSGVGLTGLTIAIGCSPSCIYLTDCHSSVLNTLSDNVRLNMEKIATNNDSDNKSDASGKLKLLQDRCLYHNLGKSDVFVLSLPWEEVNKESCRKLGTINKVIAADVVYDSELFNPLISALKCLVSVCSVDEFIFSCTERNKSTLEDFLVRVGEASFAIEELQIPRQNNFIWPNDTRIRLLRFTAK